MTSLATEGLKLHNNDLSQISLDFCFLGYRAYDARGFNRNLEGRLFVKRLYKFSVAFQFKVYKIRQVLAETLGKLKRIRVAHSVILENVEVFVYTTKTRIHVTKVVIEYLVQDRRLSLSWMPAHVKKSTLVFLNIRLDKTLDSLRLLISSHNLMVS